jgi:hypothetical protein
MEGAVAAAARAVFKGSISSCFEPHLRAYVDLEERQLAEHLDKIVADEAWDVDESAQVRREGGGSLSTMLDTSGHIRAPMLLTSEPPCCTHESPHVVYIRAPMLYTSEPPCCTHQSPHVVYI